MGFKKNKKYKLNTLLFLLLLSNVSLAQLPTIDTLNITLDKAEQLFLKNNLQIIAEKYSVDATRALIIQARLYPNPNFSISQSGYDQATGKWFETGPNSEQAYQLSQLIVLTRKIKKGVDIAETNYKLAEDNMYDLLRTLKLALRSTFYNIYYMRQTAAVYNEEITALKTIIAAYKQVVDKGYVAKSDLALIQAQLFSLQNEYQTLIDNINDQESQLRLILQTTPYTYYIPTVDPAILNADPLKYSLGAMLDSAYKNRTDLMIAKDNMLLSQQTLTLQKALAVPDVTLGINSDRHGSYYTDFNSLSLGFDIPIFNRNQGNIKSARSMVEYNNSNLQLAQKTLEETVFRGLQKAIDADKLYKSIDPSFSSSFDTLAKEMMKNYVARNVSLLNFLTFYDSYKQNIIQLNTIMYNKVNTLENLNYLTGTNFFNK